MKKIYLAVVLIGLLIAFVVPQFILAADPDIPNTCTVHARAVKDVCSGHSAGAKIGIDQGDNALCCVISSIYRVTDWVFFFLMAIVVFMVLLGAFSLLTAGGDPEKVDKGRKYILWAAVGFIVALLAWTVPELAKTIMGLSKV